MTSPTYSDCDCPCIVCTLDWVVPGPAGWVEGLAPVVTGIGEAVLMGTGEEGSVLKGFSSNRSEKWRLQGEIVLQLPTRYEGYFTDQHPLSSKE